MKIPTLAVKTLSLAILLMSAHAASSQQSCAKIGFCVVSTDHTNPNGSRAVHVILQNTDPLATHFNVQAPGAPQFEVAAGGGSFDFLVPASGATTFNVQSCTGGGGGGSNCGPWTNFAHMLTCPSGLVWRESFDGDALCVPPDQRFRLANGSCRVGFVWRDSFSGDNVCVTPAERDTAKAAAASAAPPPKKVVALGKTELATAINDVDVYTGPDGSFAVVGFLPAHQVCRVSGHQSGWYQLVFKNGQVQNTKGKNVTSGWVAEDHLTIR